MPVNANDYFNNCEKKDNLKVVWDRVLYMSPPVADTYDNILPAL